MLKSMRPVDLGIAAGAAALIAAGAIAALTVWGGENMDAAPEETAAIDSTSVFDARFDWQPQAERTAELVPNADPGPVGEVDEDGVRKVTTETIKIEAVEIPSQVQTASLTLSSFTAADRRISGGCGLLLTRADDKNAIVFFHELASADGESRGFAQIGDEMVSMKRSSSSGDPLGFGQYPLQEFDSEDGRYHALVNIELTIAEDGALRIPVSRGQLIMTGPSGQTVTVPVSGDAGC